MFDKQNTIMHIDREKLTVANVSIRKRNIKEKFEIEAGEQGIVKAFQIARKKAKSKTIRLLVGEEFSFVLGVLVPKNISQEKEFVREKIKEMIPADLGELVWDYKEFFEAHSYKTAQAIAIFKDFHDVIETVLAKAKLKVEAMESISLSLARQTQNEDEPHLIIYNGVEALGLVAYKGFVMASVKLGTQGDTSRIQNLMSLVEERYDFKPVKLILSGAKLDSNNTDGFKTEERYLDPFVSLAFKSDIKGKDEDVLNLEIL